MKTLTYLFEFYENTADEWHSEFGDFASETLAEAITRFAEEYPQGRIINHYVQVNKDGEPT
jgi:hypothetical protein